MPAAIHYWIFLLRTWALWALAPVAGTRGRKRPEQLRQGAAPPPNLAGEARPSAPRPRRPGHATGDSGADEAYAAAYDKKKQQSLDEGLEWKVVLRRAQSAGQAARRKAKAAKEAKERDANPGRREACEEGGSEGSIEGSCGDA